MFTWEAIVSIGNSRDIVFISVMKAVAPRVPITPIWKFPPF